LGKIRLLSVYSLLPHLVKLLVSTTHKVMDDRVCVDVAKLFTEVFIVERRPPDFATHEVLMVWVFFLSQVQRFELLPDG